MEKKNMKINIDKETAQGKYSNIVLTVHSPSEFIFDFAKILPGLNEANVHTRIIMTPMHTKLFLNSLKDAVEKFEKTFGEIKINEKQSEKNIGFVNN